MIGVNALAAVSAVFPVVFLLFSFLIGIASGSTVLIGQAYGARDEHKVKKMPAPFWARRCSLRLPSRSLAR